MSHASSAWRKEATMIAIATIRLRLATMAARDTATCPGAPRSCDSASCGATATRGGQHPEQDHDEPGQKLECAQQQQRDREVTEQRQTRSRRGERAQGCGGERRATPGPIGRRRVKARSSSPARSASAGAARAASSAGSRPPTQRHRDPEQEAKPARAAGTSVKRRRECHGSNRSPDRVPVMRTASVSEQKSGRNAEACCRSRRAARLRRRAGPRACVGSRRAPAAERSRSRRRTTESTWVEKTSRPPVNSATRANTSMLMR